MEVNMSEITNKVLNTVGSIGNVNIEIYKGTKKIKSIKGHNKGTIELCKYLRDALTGSNVSSHRPGRIVPCERSGTGDLVNLFNYGIQYLPESVNKAGSRNDDGTDSAWLDMGFIIPNTLLSPGNKIAGFRLCRNILDQSGKLVTYAEIDFEDQGLPDIEINDNNTSIRVDWRIKISIVSSMEEEEF